MKLKKIASLALAGVMAVSMLAGCGNNNSSSTGDQGNTVVETTGIAKELNDAQIAGNAVKIDFAADSKFEAELTEAAKRAGQGAGAQTVMGHLQLVSGIVAQDNCYDDVAFGDQMLDTSSSPADLVNGKTVTALVVNKSTALTKEAAVKAFAKSINDEIAKLNASSDEDDPVGAGETYYAFGYTGKAAMVEVANNDGTTSYYFAVVVTQTCTETERK